MLKETESPKQGNQMEPTPPPLLTPYKMGKFNLSHRSVDPYQYAVPLFLCPRCVHIRTRLHSDPCRVWCTMQGCAPATDEVPGVRERAAVTHGPVLLPAGDAGRPPHHRGLRGLGDGTRVPRRAGVVG